MKQKQPTGINYTNQIEDLSQTYQDESIYGTEGKARLNKKDNFFEALKYIKPKNSTSSVDQTKIVSKSTTYKNVSNNENKNYINILPISNTYKNNNSLLVQNLQNLQKSDSFTNSKENSLYYDLKEFSEESREIHYNKRNMIIQCGDVFNKGTISKSVTNAVNNSMKSNYNQNNANNINNINNTLNKMGKLNIPYVPNKHNTHLNNTNTQNTTNHIHINTIKSKNPSSITNNGILSYNKNSTCNNTNTNNNTYNSNKSFNLQDLDKEDEVFIERNQMNKLNMTTSDDNTNTINITQGSIKKIYNKNNNSNNSRNKIESFEEEDIKSEILIIEDDNDIDKDFEKFNMNFKYTNTNNTKSSHKRKDGTGFHILDEINMNKKYNVNQNLLLNLEEDLSLFNHSLIEEEVMSSNSNKKNNQNLVNMGNIDDNNTTTPAVKSILNCSNRILNNNSIKTSKLFKHTNNKSSNNSILFTNKLNSSNQNEVSFISFNNKNKFFASNMNSKINSNVNSNNVSICQLSRRESVNNKYNNNNSVLINVNANNMNNNMNNTLHSLKSSIVNEIHDVVFENNIENHENFNNEKNISQQHEINNVNSIFDVDFINNLIERDSYYKPDYSSLSGLKFFTKEFPEIRAIMLDWLMQLSEEFGFKRDSYHLSINLFDRYYINSYKRDNCIISKNIIQLVGCTVLCIASKFEEIQIPRAEEYIRVTDNTFNLEQLISLEKEIISTLKWELTPPTLNTWLNWYISQWDIFLESFYNDKIYSTYNIKLYFKRADDTSYHLFRQITQLMDLISIDLSHLTFENRKIIAGCLFYCLIINCSNCVNPNELNNEPCNICNNCEVRIQLTNENSNSLYSNHHSNIIINNVFKDFLYQSFNFTLSDIKETLEYIWKFINYTEYICVELPLAVKYASEDDSQINNVSLLSIF